jgi:endonuclease/exonuclease/phosphatase (EEP) superfamily protein YafD
MRVFKALAWLALIVGIVLQLWFKDRHVSWALLFYAMPKPCLIALAFVLAVDSRRVRWQQIPAVTAMISLTIWWAMTSLSFAVGPAKSETPNEVTLLYWNLCRPNQLDREAVEMVKELNPHLVAFVEPGKNVSPLLPSYEALLPSYTVAWMPRGILWLSRVPSRYRERGKLDGAGAYARFEVNDLGPAFPVVVADVTPHFFHSREQQLTEALAQSQDRSDSIIVGDFNTPLESAMLDGYRARFANALEVGGTGFRETWPMGLPLLSIDHVWVGKHWEVIEAKKIWCLTGSDHAAIFVRLRRR